MRPVAPRLLRHARVARGYLDRWLTACLDDPCDILGDPAAAAGQAAAFRRWDAGPASRAGSSRQRPPGLSGRRRVVVAKGVAKSACLSIPRTPVSSTVRGLTVPRRYPRSPGSLLVPEPAVRTGALIGYTRVSTSGQLFDRQQPALAEAGRGYTAPVRLRTVADEGHMGLGRGTVRGTARRIVPAQRVPLVQWLVSSVQVARTVRGTVLLVNGRSVVRIRSPAPSSER